MPLVDCPGCGRKVSDEAESCPSCGSTIVVARHTPAGAVTRLKIQSVLASAVALSCLFALVVTAIHPPETGHGVPAVIVAGLFVSGIVWYAVAQYLLSRYPG
ncbi:MAG: hypothetical protein COV67_09675 [Nitrospinae bacterium CG11_big_fil_rev_8_21_14_0_20_56_8]|nr:MAG: hypothetical protein COV67_09675 [Nitrospinae bacterium CG11_big_fil_rev_8_21_14_0_20_56_8]